MPKYFLKSRIKDYSNKKEIELINEGKLVENNFEEKTLVYEFDSKEGLIKVTVDYSNSILLINEVKPHVDIYLALQVNKMTDVVYILEGEHEMHLQINTYKAEIKDTNIYLDYDLYDNPNLKPVTRNEVWIEKED